MRRCIRAILVVGLITLASQALTGCGDSVAGTATGVRPPSDKPPIAATAARASLTEQQAASQIYQGRWSLPTAGDGTEGWYEFANGTVRAAGLGIAGTRQGTYSISGLTASMKWSGAESAPASSIRPVYLDGKVLVAEVAGSDGRPYEQAFARDASSATDFYRTAVTAAPDEPGVSLVDSLYKSGALKQDNNLLPKQ